MTNDDSDPIISPQLALLRALFTYLLHALPDVPVTVVAQLAEVSLGGVETTLREFERAQEVTREL